MEAGTLEAGTHRTYLAGLGVSAALMAAVATAFFLVGGFVAYTSWPGGSIQDSSHSASVRGMAGGGAADAATAAGVALDDAPAAVAQAPASPSLVAIAVATGTPIPVAPGGGGPDGPGGGVGGPPPGGGGGGPGPGPGPGTGGPGTQTGLLGPTVAQVVGLTGTEPIGPTLQTLGYTVGTLTRPVTGLLQGGGGTNSSGSDQQGLLDGLLGR